MLSDLVLPALTWLQALTLVQRVCPGVPFIVLSGMISDKAAGRILSSRAMTYVPKHRLSDLPHSIRRVLSDGVYTSIKWPDSMILKTSHDETVSGVMPAFEPFRM